jgi:hypothetical protein
MSKTAEAGRESASLDRVRADARRLGLDIAPVRLAEGTRTAEDAARACGCGVDQIVKSIVFREADTDRHVLSSPPAAIGWIPARRRAWRARRW